MKIGPVKAHMPTVQKVRAAGQTYYRGTCICGEHQTATLIRKEADAWAETHGLADGA